MNSLGGLRAKLLARLLAIGIVVVVVGGLTVQIIFTRTTERQLAARAQMLGDILSYGAETFTKRTSLQRFVSAASADRDVDLLIVAAGSPARVVASSNPSWAGRLISDFDQAEGLYQDLQGVLATGTPVIGRLDRFTYRLHYAAPIQTFAPDQAGWIGRGAIAVQLKPDLLKHELRQFTLEFLAVLGSVIAALLVGVLILLRKHVLDPIHTIAKSITTQANLPDKRRAIRWAGEDEIDLLAKTLQESIAALSEKKRQYRSLVDNIPGVTYRRLLDDKHTMLYISSGVEELSGYAARDFIDNRNRTYASIVHPDDREFVNSSIIVAIAQRRSFKIEYRIVQSGGTIAWVFEKGQPQFSSQGEALWVDGFIFDQTDRKQAELERQRAIADLGESERHHRTVFDSALDAVVTIDASGRITRWNAQAERTFGWSHAEVLSRPLADIIIPHAQRRAHLEGLAHFNLTHVGQILNKRLEVTALRRDNTEFPCELTITSSASHGSWLFTAFLRDISERKTAEAELHRHRDHLQELVDERTRDLNVAKEHAEEANRVKSEFLANMSHELRTPMHAILSFARRGREYCDESVKLQRYFSNILISGNRLLELLNALLDLAKLEAGHQDWTFSKQDLQGVLTQVTNELQILASERDVSIQSSVLATDTLISCDQGRIVQVVRNIVGNAIKFSPAGGRIDIELTDALLPVQGEKEDCAMPAIMVQVRDQGPGIPANELEAIFDKFYQSSKTRTGAGGTGLGLAICKEIVSAHGGVIQAFNNDTGGAGVRVILPRVYRHNRPNLEVTDESITHIGR